MAVVAETRGAYGAAPAGSARSRSRLGQVLAQRIGPTVKLGYVDQSRDSLAGEKTVEVTTPEGETRTLTYFDLHRQVSQFGSVLRTLGVKKGDRVALYLVNSPQFVIAYFAKRRRAG